MPALVLYGRADYPLDGQNITGYETTQTAPTIEWGHQDPDFNAGTKDFYFTDADGDGTVDMVVNCIRCRGGLGELRILHNLPNWLDSPEPWESTSGPPQAR